MLVIPGRAGKDTCDGITRRELLRVGGSAVLGLSLANLFGLQKPTAKEATYGGPGFGKAKSVILLYLQGGPSHLDLWDPKDNVPDNVTQRLQADRHQDARRPVHRAAAEARPGERQGHDDPLDELHARSACSTTRPPSTRC